MRNILSSIRQFPPLRGQDAAAVHHHFRNGLIHGHPAAERAGAGIGHAHQVQGGLNLAVLPIGAVEAQENTISQGTDFQHVFAQTAGALELPGGLHRFQVRSGLFNGYIAAEAVRRVEGSFQGAFKILQTQVHIHKYGLMAPLAQGFTYRGGSDQGDMALGTEAAAQNNDLHGNHPFRGIKNRASMNMA